jgi:lipoprotein-anchoring transpeptidase ErfK/SrfK
MPPIVKAFALSCILLLATQASSVAQGWPPWADNVFGNPHGTYDRSPHWREPVNPREEQGRSESNQLGDGGPRPEIAPKAPPIAPFPYDFPVDSIVIDTGGRKLYFILPGNRAYEYAISVGRDGFNWTGTETVSRKQAWPDWYPPAEMRERDPTLPEKMTGGIKNPLGAIALYLGKSLYRIHGTNDVKSIGQAASSGCFRMLNSAVLHLASVTQIGTTVTVVEALPGRQEISRASQVPPPRAAGHGPATTAPAGSEPGLRTFRDYHALRDGTLQSR